MSPPKPEDSTTPRLCRQTYWSRVAFCGGIQPEVAEARQRPICGRAPTGSRPPAGHSDAPSVHYRRPMRRCGLMRMGISAASRLLGLRIWSVPCPGHLLLCYRLPCPQVTAYPTLLLDPSEPMWCWCPSLGRYVSVGAWVARVDSAPAETSRVPHVEVGPVRQRVPGWDGRRGLPRHLGDLDPRGRRRAVSRYRQGDQAGRRDCCVHRPAAAHQATRLRVISSPGCWHDRRA
jgi:hypothetical protein